MSNTIQPNYGTRAYSATAKNRRTRQSGTQPNGFLAMAARLGGGGETLMSGLESMTGMASMPASLMMDLSVRASGQVQTEGVAAAEAPSLEAMLKTKYPTETVLSITQAQVWGGAVL